MRITTPLSAPRVHSTRTREVRSTITTYNDRQPLSMVQLRWASAMAPRWMGDPVISFRLWLHSVNRSAPSPHFPSQCQRASPKRTRDPNVGSGIGIPSPPPECHLPVRSGSILHPTSKNAAGQGKRQTPGQRMGALGKHGVVNPNEAGQYRTSPHRSCAATLCPLRRRSG